MLTIQIGFEEINGQKTSKGTAYQGSCKNKRNARPKVSRRRGVRGHGNQGGRADHGCGNRRL